MTFLKNIGIFNFCTFYLITLLNKKSSSGATCRLYPMGLKFCMWSYIWYWNGKTLRLNFSFEKVVFWDTLIEYECLRDLKTWEWIAAFEHSENFSIGSNIMVDHTFKNYFRFFGCNISLQIVQISSKGHLKVNGRQHLMQLVC